MDPIPQTFTLGEASAAVHARIAQLDSFKFPERLWARDTSLWGEDPAHQKVAANRLGWLGSPAMLREQVSALESFAKDVRHDGITHAVLLGMGGSSLAPEVLRLTFGVGHGAIDVSVLDSTSPAAVRAVAAAHDPTKTLFIVSSKSGGTIEVSSFERHFWNWMVAAVGPEQAGRHFIAITDPGTALEDLAASRGYRHTFTNPADIGGRYSALSYFGMVPAALLGIDVTAVLERALEEATASHTASTGGALPSGFVLGATLGELAVRGRDKMTLVLGHEVQAFASWVEQLVAESTGKSGKGIVPVADEPLGPPELYGGDRVFVAFSVVPLPAATEAALDVLAAAGHPVLRWRLRDLASIGEEFLRWEIATATASAILEVDPFDEPNVTEAKQATQAVLERQSAGASAHATAAAAAIEVPAKDQARLAAAMNGRTDPGSWVAALLSLARPGDYFAVLAYVHRTDLIHERLQRLRVAARAGARVATTLGYGPRFLHSTGQLHKGGPGTGIFLQLTADEGADLPIPEAPYSFAQLLRAQAAGDYEVLERRGRRVVHVHLGADTGRILDEIAESLGGARV